MLFVGNLFCHISILYLFMLENNKCSNIISLLRWSPRCVKCHKLMRWLSAGLSLEKMSVQKYPNVCAEHKYVVKVEEGASLIATKRVIFGHFLRIICDRNAKSYILPKWINETIHR